MIIGQKFLSLNRNNIIIIIVIILGIAGAICFCSRNNEPTADSNRNEIEQAGRTQAAITDRLENAEQSAGNISEGIDRSQTAISNAADAAGRIERNLEESGKLIAEIYGILQEVRKTESQKSDERIQPAD